MPWLIRRAQMVHETIEGTFRQTNLTNESAEYLAKRGICVWSGNYYALRLMERLGLEAEGGAVSALRPPHQGCGGGCSRSRMTFPCFA